MHYGYGYFEEAQLGRIRDLKLWKRLLKILRPYWKPILGAALLSLVISAAGLIIPYLVRVGVDRYITAENLAWTDRLHGLRLLALLFIGLMLLGFLANFFQVVLLEWAGQQVMHDLRQRLFHHVVHLDVAFFNRHPVGKLVTRLTNDIQNMHEAMTSVVVTVFNDFLQLFGILVILFWMDWRLTGMLCTVIPLMVVVTLLFSRLARESFRELRTRLARINAFLQEVLSGLFIVQLFQREQDTASRFESLNEAHRLAAFRQIHVFGVFMPFIEVVHSTTVAIMIWYGGRSILNESMTLGTLIAFLSYVRLCFQPLRELSQKYSIVQSALASAERIFELLDTPKSLSEPSAPKTLPHVRGALTFEHVYFSYDDDRFVLQDVSFHVDPGETLAIVGATGAGKTTLIHLLEKFYEPTHGRILLDGHDMRCLDVRWLRRQIGLVMQDVFLVPGTLRENICLDLTLDAKSLDRIVELAQLGSLIRRLPQGLETLIGPGGVDLSAGQKQLLAFARVLARDPRILILDEATSNVDSSTERDIEAAVEKVLTGRTAILIAHRLSTVQRASRILVLENGRVMESGRHEDLLRQNGYYARLLHSSLVCRSTKVNGDFESSNRFSFSK
ncbi:MAG: ABC transporter ATP-binding protein [Desulfosoma sp.]